MNVQDFQPDVNQGGLSISNLKRYLPILEATFLLSSKMAFEGKMEYNHRRATDSENAAEIG